MRKVSSIGCTVLVAVLVGGCEEKPPDATPAPQSAAASTSDPAHAADAQSETVQVFWQEFRDAVLADDRAALLKKVRFPFTTRGPIDDDPVISHDQSGFWEVYARLMAQDVGLSMEPQTVRQFIESHPQPPPIALGGGRMAAVAEDAEELHAGPLNFEKIGGRWFWVSAFEEE